MSVLFAVLLLIGIDVAFLWMLSLFFFDPQPRDPKSTHSVEIERVSRDGRRWRGQDRSMG